MSEPKPIDDIVEDLRLSFGERLDTLYGHYMMFARTNLANSTIPDLAEAAIFFANTHIIAGYRVGQYSREMMHDAGAFGPLPDERQATAAATILRGLHQKRCESPIDHTSESE